MMDLRHVEAFCAITQLGTFSAAAVALCTTQPAISMRIRELEYQLGAKLFDTASRRTKLTVKGRDFMPHAENLLRLARSIQEEMAETGHVAGHLRLGATETVALTWLSTFVERARDNFPKVVLELDISLTDDLWTKFRAGELDMIFIPAPIIEPKLRSEKLGRIRYSWMVSPKLGIPGGLLTPKDLSQYPIISLSSASALYHMAERWFGESGAKANWVSHCSSLNMVEALTRAGLGISLLPPDLMANDGRNQELMEVKVHPPYPDLTFFAVYREMIAPRMCYAICDLAKEVSTFIRDG